MRILNIGKRILRVLEPAQRRAALGLLPLMVVRAVIDTVGVATVLPFIAVVADPEGALSNRYLGGLYRALGFQDVRSFLILLGLGAFLVLLVSNSLTVAVEFLLKRFAQRQSHLLQRRLMYLALARPYEDFLGDHSAEIGQNILGEVRQFIDGVLSPYLQVVARFIATLVLLGMLVAVDPLLAVTTGVVLAGVYALIFQLVRRVLNRIGKERQVADKARFRTVAETYGGIKDVKVSGRERTFLERFALAARRHAGLEVVLHVTRIVPRSLLEVVAFSGIIGIILYLLSTGRSTSTVISIVTLYAFACYRLIPAVQLIYESVSQLKYSLPSLELIERTFAAAQGRQTSLETGTPLALESQVEMRGVSYAYPNAEAPSLHGVDLVIRRGTATAIVGPTGSGKSTVLDLLLGLLRPAEGAVLVDGEPLTPERVRAWQAAIGYVPQHVFLSDDTVARNIAFGVPEDEVDAAAVERAARIAQIHDFVAELPEGYETRIGERGVRLSGGQRQRLGIARALYKDPPVLVLDEATSALDSVTEEAVFASLAELAGLKTVVLVTHRVSTVKGCDQVVVLDGGRVAGSGTYDELMRTSAAFQALARSRGDAVAAGG
ncbi:MAG TPA: ABC transporter ATP-binding protein [Trueperaceae bacterium]